jgi:Ca2+-binding RTX toxin-like protein
MMLTLRGTDGADILTGGAEDDLIDGAAGNDSLGGSGGNDTIIGGAGADSLVGGAGDDRLYSFVPDPTLNPEMPWLTGASTDIFNDPDTLIGGDGDDHIFAGVGDFIDGGASRYGNSISISFLGSATGVQADFRQFRNNDIDVVINGTTIRNIRHVAYIEGSNFDDLLAPVTSYYSNGSSVYGRGGNDTLIAEYYTGTGGSGLFGGDGNDTLDGTFSQYGGVYNGDAGDDLIDTRSGSPVTADGGDGNDILLARDGTIRGGAGDDRITLQFSSFPIALGDSGNDQITGSSSLDRLFGGSGADTIIGGGGADTIASSDGEPSTFYYVYVPQLDSGAERDVIDAGAGDDIVFAGFGDDADGGDGNDTLTLSLAGSAEGVTFDASGLAGGGAVTFAGGTIRGFETIEKVYGTRFDDTIIVGTQSSLVSIDAGNGNDVIVSSGSSVSILGGAGNDYFISGAAGDIFNGGEGFNTVGYINYTSGITITLGAFDEVVTGPGGDQITNVSHVNGSEFGDLIRGNIFPNRLAGLGGNDTLEGGGGADLLIGGFGNDTFYVENLDDTVVEAAGEGADAIIVRATASNFVLSAGVDVETLSADTGTAPINITGNWQSQTINGNDGANILSAGGPGAPDTLNGGLGDDTYRVFATGDVINDTGGNDIVYASGTSYFLYSTAAVETLSTSLHAGTESFYLVGNGASQVIIGNFGDNIINGRSGDGQGNPDTLIGLAGNDTFAVFLQGDVVREEVGQGSDIVVANASYQLREGTEIEVLTAVDQTATAASQQFTLRGNGFAQTIVGNDTVNVLDGRGGNDVLIGRGGNDTFAFTTALGSGNVDTIQDFAAGDRIGLASDIFGSVTADGIVAGEFVIGTAAADGDDRLIYDQATGRLWLDADGNGAGAAVLFAQLAAGTVLSASSFVVIAPVASLPAA